MKEETSGKNFCIILFACSRGVQKPLTYTIVYAMNRGIPFWVYSSSKDKICEDKSITCDRFDVMQTKSHNSLIL